MSCFFLLFFLKKKKKKKPFWPWTIMEEGLPSMPKGFIDEILKKPKLKEGGDTSKLHAWKMVNSMICSWILNATYAKLCPHIPHVNVF